MGELVGLGLSGLLWVGLARAVTNARGENRHSLIAVIAFSIPCLLFTLMAFLATAPPAEILGLQLLSTLVWWVVVGRPTPPARESHETPREREEPRQEPRPFPPGISRCQSCSAELTDGAKFCEECGADVARERTCTRCGATSRPGAKFCKGCGGSFKRRRAAEQAAT